MLHFLPHTSSNNFFPWQRGPWVAALVVAAVVSGGCSTARNRWQGPAMATPLEQVAWQARASAATSGLGSESIQQAAYRPDGPATWISSGQLRDEAERHYATALKAHYEGDFSRATHESFQAALSSWNWIDFHARLPTGTNVSSDQGRIAAVPPSRAVDLYHSSVTLLISSAQRAKRLEPSQGIWLDGPDGPQLLKIHYHGFAWRPEDFDVWLPVGDYHSTRVERIHRRKGWGVPLVIIHNRPESARFMGPRIPFPATAMLRPIVDNDEQLAIPFTNEVPFALELFEPRSIGSLQGRGGDAAPLAADLSAPFAWLDNTAPRRYLEAFRRPDELGRGQLEMFEPYQPGKIPVILVHGLLSEPLAWLGLANDLTAHPEFSHNYQIWAFRYPTGKPYLTSAADLRSDMQELIAQLSAEQHDPALEQCVLIGHSMGGLVSKLQVTESRDQLWRAFSNRPFQEMVLDDSQRHLLGRQFFFQPQPFVKRVIFIGTPHRGSGLASTWVARLGINQIRRQNDVTEEYEQLVENNPGAINPQFTGHIPTSVDMLQPDDSLLQAVYGLPVASDVALHSIVGVNHHVPFEGDGDGVVPRESARHPGVETERFVDARHETMHTEPVTVREVENILMRHAIGFKQQLAAVPSFSNSMPFVPEFDDAGRLLPMAGSNESLERIEGN